MQIFIPPPLRRVKKCERCGLLYPHKEDSCAHCTDLNDQQLEELKQRYAHESHGNAFLGNKLLFAAGIIVLLMIIFIGYQPT